MNGKIPKWYLAQCDADRITHHNPSNWLAAGSSSQRAFVAIKEVGVFRQQLGQVEVVETRFIA